MLIMCIIAPDQLDLLPNGREEGKQERGDDVHLQGLGDGNYRKPIQKDKVGHRHVADGPDVVVSGVFDLVVLGVHLFVYPGRMPQSVDGPEDDVSEEEPDGKIPYHFGPRRSLVWRDESPRQHGLAAFGHDKDDMNHSRYNVVPKTLRYHLWRCRALVRRPHLLHEQPEYQVDNLHRDAPHNLDVAWRVSADQLADHGGQWRLSLYLGLVDLCLGASKSLGCWEQGETM